MNFSAGLQGSWQEGRLTPFLFFKAVITPFLFFKVNLKFSLRFAVCEYSILGGIQAETVEFPSSFTVGCAVAGMSQEEGC